MPFFGFDSLSKERKKFLLAFQKTASIRFRNIKFLDRAFVHRSCANEESADIPNNERLEFLGDSVLGVVVASYLYNYLPTKNEGELARIKSFVVSEDSLSVIAKELNVDRLLLVGKGEELSGGRNKKAILADTMEAVIGAYYIDSGFASVEKFILNLIVPEIDKVLQNRHKKDYKTIIQEFVQKTYKSYPKYTLLRKTGPDHDRTFWITVTIENATYGEAKGKNKKEAEQSAARLAFDSILAEKSKKSEILKSFEE